ncbi:hypothetical protein EXIGLDRAFT_718776 [Exidia glandulosa HHB12029]|uniref:Uncharacterized protein n=1 Tax=Exidia glandulosa HHB12029 TaxID=1314781 RepID=A0A165HHH8_EXIGL|nr:hypothetical protein EXIGLDRAFT_718776 [Exidia glandulosa HHB12029]
MRNERRRVHRSDRLTPSLGSLERLERLGQAVQVCGGAANVSEAAQAAMHFADALFRL